MTAIDRNFMALFFARIPGLTIAPGWVIPSPKHTKGFVSWLTW